MLTLILASQRWAEARACGQEAVKLAMSEVSGSVAIKRLGSGKDYAVELLCTELGNVAEKTKLVPDEYINAEGNGVTDAFVEYAMPLTGGLPGRFRPYLGRSWANFVKFAKYSKNL